MDNIYTPSLICPYHRQISYADIEELNNHMQKYHWQGIDIFQKPKDEKDGI